MELLWYFIGTFLIATIVFLTAFFSIKLFIENEQKKKLLELKHNSKSVITPLRLQAYERMALFLERIEPAQLLSRINTAELDAPQLRSLLLTAIRSEFDHNLSQQIYISIPTWDTIVMAKEEMIQLVNLSSGKVGIEASALDLVTEILDQTSNGSPIQPAMKSLKDEIQLLF